MSNNVILIAGQGGAKSTFAGGLLHHVKKSETHSVTKKVDGNRTDYEQNVIDRMFGEGQYPEQTDNGYIAHYTIAGSSFVRNDMTVDIVDLPGEGVGISLNPPGQVPLMTRIRNGNVRSRDDIKDDYEDNLESDFKRGISPNNQQDWETAFLHHYYQADKAIFLLNLWKLTDDDSDEIVYDNEAVEHATDEFTDVAVIPMAVDWFNYDAGQFDPGLLERISMGMLYPGYRDNDLLDFVEDNIGMGTSQKAADVFGYVKQDPEIDFFSVAVPDQGSPQNETGDLTNDGNGGFVVKGFGEVIKWLQS